MTNGWTGSADGTREQRHYYAQNWRADVSAIFDNAGAVMEWQKYSAYGVPYLITPGDHNKDGVVNKTDQDAFDEDYTDGVVSRADLNKDGAVTSADQTLFTASYAKATVGGRWKLSGTSIGSRKGYAGYEHEGFGNDLAAPELAHVRHRVLHFELGRWTRRDPLGYVDGRSLYDYARMSPIAKSDPAGLFANADFVDWYFFGGGATLDLGEVGLGQKYEAHPVIRARVAEETQRVRELATTAAITMADSYRCDCFVGPQISSSRMEGRRPISIGRTEFIAQGIFASLTVASSAASWFWYSDWTYSLGGHHLQANHSCELGVKCGYCGDGDPCENGTHILWYFTCTIQFEVEDRFEDPLSVFEMLRNYGGRLNPLVTAVYDQYFRPAMPGSPYDITYSFARGFGGSGMLPKDHTPCIAEQ